MVVVGQEIFVVCIVELQVVLDIVLNEFSKLVKDRVDVVVIVVEVMCVVQVVIIECDQIIVCNDEILMQVEDVVLILVKLLDQMFCGVGMNFDEVLSIICKGYFGEGGSFSLISYFFSGDVDIMQGEVKVNEILIMLDKMNFYCIVVEKMLLVMLVQLVFCYILFFGCCWGWMYVGIDMVVFVGIEIFVIGDGEVIFVGW